MNFSKRFAALLISIMILTASTLFQTYAKYTDYFSSNDTASIAKWDVSFFVNEQKITQQNQGVKLFNNAILAPNDSGTITMRLLNQSDVDVNANVALSINTIYKSNITSTLTVPLKFTYNNKVYNSISDLQVAINIDLAKVTYKSGNNGNSGVNENFKNIQFTYQWVSNSDVEDIQIEKTIAALKMNVSVQINQFIK